MTIEYRVIPAPRRGKRGNGVKGNPGRFANALETSINTMAADGWEFVRAETLGADEREGMMRRRVETFHSVLVFKRAVQAEMAAPAPVAPVATKPEPAPPAPKAEKKPAKKPEPKLEAEKAAEPAEKPKATKVKAADATVSKDQDADAPSASEDK